jgi:U3 small nucleolar RNA-associated protein 10
MTLLCEVLASVSMPGSVELLARLMDLLHKLVQNSSINKSDSNYLQQLLMSVIENTADKIKVCLYNINDRALFYEYSFEL